MGRNERLKSRKQIEKLFREGKRISVNPFRVFYLEGAALMPMQAGFGVGTRQFNRAVDRNRIKRLTREAYRLQKHKLQEGLTINNRSITLFIIFTGKQLPEQAFVHEKIGLMLEKLSLLINEKPPSHP